MHPSIVSGLHVVIREVPAEDGMAGTGAAAAWPSAGARGVGSADGAGGIDAVATGVEGGDWTTEGAVGTGVVDNTESARPCAASGIGDVTALSVGAA